MIVAVSEGDVAFAHFADRPHVIDDDFKRRWPESIVWSHFLSYADAGSVDHMYMWALAEYLN